MLAILVLAVLLGVSLSSSSSSKRPTPSRSALIRALAGAAAVHRQFAGIPQHGNVLGSLSAPVTLVEYVDLQCPYCDQFELRVLPNLLSRYVRTGKVKIEARPIAFIGPDSKRGRAAAIAAGQQNRMFNYMELLYANQKTENTGWLSDSMVEKAAASIPGLAVPRLLAARNSAAIKSAEARFDSLANTDNVRGTPTIFVGKSGGTLSQVALSSPTDEAAVATAIASSLR